MEVLTEYKDLTTEILIPLENTLTYNTSDTIFEEQSDPSPKNSSNKFSDLSKILSLDFTNYRNILFQNEYLRYFLIIKFNSISNSNSNSQSFLDEIYIQSKFLKSDSQLILNENQVEDDLQFQIENSSLTYCNISTELLNDENNFSEYDQIINKLYIKEKNIAIIELRKHILVPFSYVNLSLIFNVNIYKKTKYDHTIQGKRKEDIDYFNIQNYNIYNAKINTSRVDDLILIKSVSKEIKIIRPLYITQSKQLDYSIDSSFFEIKLENITETVNFIDKYLQKSDLLPKNNQGKNIKFVYFGINFIINDIRVLKNDTIINNQMTLNLKSLEQTNEKKQLPIALNSANFKVLNKDFPILIKPGEEYNISLMLNKGNYNISKGNNDDENLSYEWDSSYNYNDIEYNEEGFNKNNISTEDLDEASFYNCNNALINTSTSSKFNNTHSNNKTLKLNSRNEQQPYQSKFFKINITNYISEKDDVNNRYKNLNSNLENYEQLNNRKNKNSDKNLFRKTSSSKKTQKNSLSISNANVSMFKFKNDDRQIKENEENEYAQKRLVAVIKEEDENNEDNDSYQGGRRLFHSPKKKIKKKDKKNDSQNDVDNKKLILNLITPILLSLEPSSNYSQMSMRINLQWKTEIDNNIKIIYNISEQEKNNIKVNNFFSVGLLFKNTSANNGNYYIEFNNSFNDCGPKDEGGEIKKKCSDGLPEVVSEVKKFDLGAINAKEEKEICIKFLPMKSGYITLPSFNLYEQNSNKKFFIIHTNKLYVNDD